MPLPFDELGVNDRSDLNALLPDVWLFLRLLVFFSAEPLIDNLPVSTGGGAGGGGAFCSGMSCLKHIVQ